MPGNFLSVTLGSSSNSPVGSTTLVIQKFICYNQKGKRKNSFYINERGSNILKFTKMHGTGNDYIYVDCTKSTLDNPSKIAVKVSDRHFGIGSDGLILIKKSDRADFFMEMYNADGSEGKMCGNGIRCVGKYVYEHHLTQKTEITIDTLSGIKMLRLFIDDSGNVKNVSVDMGAPILEPKNIPVAANPFKISNEDTNPILLKSLMVGGKEYKVSCVSVGNPHVVLYLDKEMDIKELDIEKIGPLFEKHEAFPEGINTEFIQVVDEKNLNMRVWERGSGETFACGTGACASAVATILNGLCDDCVTVHLLGGDLKVTWDREKNTVIMEGSAQTICEGEYYEND